MDRTDVERVLAANRYLVLATADADGRPWATPLFFGRLGGDRVCWVSAPDRRHSRNLAGRAEVAITVFDSTVPVGGGQAAYFDAVAAPASPTESDAALAALNDRLAEPQQLTAEDLAPVGPLVLYVAELRRWNVLVRGGSAESVDGVDATVEV